MLIERTPTRDQLKSSFTKAEEIFLLQNSGFNVLSQVENFNSAEEFIQKTEANLRTFHYEFLARKPVLAHDYKIKKLGGSTRVVSEKYADTPLDVVTSATERDGAIKTAIDTLVRDLPETPVGSMFIITSPNGWSGLTAPNGNDYVYPESQTYVYQKISEDKVDAITIRSDLTLAQHEQLLGIAPDKNLDNKARIMNTAKSVKYLPPSPNNSFQNVVNNMAEITGNDLLWTDGEDDHTTQSILKEIDSRHDQESVEKDIQAIIDDFSKFARLNASPNNLKSLSIELGKTVMKISATHRSGASPKQTPSLQSYVKEARYISEQTGCTASESSMTSVLFESPFGVRSAVVVENGKKILRCKCPFCSKEVKAEIARGKISCPKCKKFAKYKC